jgi:hypothetical protein
MKTNLLSESGTSSWTLRQVQHLLKTRRIAIDETNKNACVFDCIEDHPFGGGRARLTLNTATQEWSFICRFCKQEGISDPLGSLEEWLNNHQVDSLGLKSHYNPMLQDEDKNAPSYLPDIDGRPLLYAGLIHFLYGKPGVFKSWLALSLVKAHDVRFWDFENGVAVTGARLKALGTPVEKGAVFDSPSDAEAIRARVKEYVKNPPEILCIDGFSGLAGVMEIDPDSNQDVLRVYTSVFAPLRRAGVTVLVLDHLPKDSTIEDFPIGAQAKKSQADAAFLVKQNSRTEEVEIFVSKDRLGVISARCNGVGFPRLLGTLALSGDTELVEIRITSVREASLNGKRLESIHARIMDAIWNFVLANPNCTKTDIERSVKGKNDLIREVLENLVEQGYVNRQVVGKTNLHAVGRTLQISYSNKG